MRTSSPSGYGAPPETPPVPAPAPSPPTTAALPPRPSRGPSTGTESPPSGRASGRLGRLALVCGVVAGLVLVASAVLPGTLANAGEDGPVAVEPSGDYRWPLDGTPRVTRPFDPPPQRWKAGHRGVDLASAPNATVRAAGAGRVHFAGYVAGRGVVSIRHGNGLLTTYQPLTPLVSKGAAVRAGNPIGRLAPGHHGCPVAACLHWGLRHGRDYLDPLTLLGYGRVRLLPLRQHR